MKLNQVIIDNVRSFKSTTAVEFNPDLNVIIGPNGGGKSNLIGLLGWALNKYFNTNFQLNKDDATTDHTLNFQPSGNWIPEPHWGKKEKPSSLVIEFVITEQDITGMEGLFSSSEWVSQCSLWIYNAGREEQQVTQVSTLTKIFDSGKTNYKKLKVGDYVAFEISLSDGNTSENPSPTLVAGGTITEPQIAKAETFLSYLQLFNLYRTTSNNSNNYNFPYVYLPPQRTISSLEVNLSGGNSFSQFSHKYQSQIENSYRSGGDSSLLADAAAYVVGESFLDDIYDKGFDFANSNFNKNSFNKTLSENLKTFDFKWTLEVKNKKRNLLQATLAKLDSEHFFDASAGSSGEKQLFNFIICFSLLNIKNSLIIIDEPELHLHPRWQKLLFDFLLKVSKENGCQFILCTHSGNFINDSHLNKVMRIYKENDASKIVEPDLTKIHPKDSIRMINAHNNDRIFFAEKVVLVEGHSDAVVWKKLVKIALKKAKKTNIIEVIEVHSKNNLSKYTSLLEKFKIPTYQIADLDYLLDVSSNSELKREMRIFSENSKTRSRLFNKETNDGRSLIKGIESFLRDDVKKTELIYLVQYLKERYSKINMEYINANRATVEKEIEKFSKRAVYILSKGDLEDYIEDYLDETIVQNYGGEKIGRAIAFISDANRENFTKWEKTKKAKEMMTIADNIVNA
jgi:predicted ATP-dependent endonuclease of OLD family